MLEGATGVFTMWEGAAGTINWNLAVKGEHRVSLGLAGPAVVKPPLSRPARARLGAVATAAECTTGPYPPPPPLSPRMGKKRHTRTHQHTLSAPSPGVTNMTMAHIHIGNATTSGDVSVFLVPVGEKPGVSGNTSVPVTRRALAAALFACELHSDCSSLLGCTPGCRGACRQTRSLLPGLTAGSLGRAFPCRRTALCPCWTPL